MLLHFLASWVCLGLLTLEVKASASTDIALLTKEIQDIKAELEAVKRNCAVIPAGGYIEEDGYIQVMKVVAGIGGQISNLLYGTTRNDDDPFLRSMTLCSCLTNQGPCNRHYWGSLVNSWDELTKSTVKLSVYKDGEEKQYVVFNATNTNYWSWMKSENIIDSSWTDIMTSTKDFIALHGDVLKDRGFFISHQSGDCATDAGWLVVKDRPDQCSWGNPEGASYPLILYSPQSTMVQWSDAEQADALAVWIKVKDTLNAACIQ